MLKFRYKVAQHGGESHSSGAFDDRLLHLDQTQYRQRNQLLSAKRFTADDRRMNYIVRSFRIV